MENAGGQPISSPIICPLESSEVRFTLGNEGCCAGQGDQYVLGTGGDGSMHGD